MRGAHRHRLGVVLLVVLTGACSPATGDPGGVGSPGCSEGTTPGARSVSLRYDGVERAYDIVVPETEQGIAMSLVLSFHGFSMSSEEQTFTTGLAVRALADGFVAVFPQGSNFGGTSPAYFNIETTDDPSLADDVGFTAEILDRVEAELCIDRSRIFVSGFSNGGMFAATLGCALGDRVAAVASVAGVHLLPDCRGRPMPIIVIHGSADPLVPLSEGDVEPAADVVRGVVVGEGGNGTELRMLEAATGTSVRSWVESWASRNTCPLTDPAVESGTEVERTAYRNCRAGGDVVLDVIEGGGHEWPASPDATARVLSFFARHPFPIDQLS